MANSKHKRYLTYKFKKINDLGINARYFCNRLKKRVSGDMSITGIYNNSYYTVWADSDIVMIEYNYYL